MSNIFHENHNPQITSSYNGLEYTTNMTELNELQLLDKF